MNTIVISEFLNPCVVTFRVRMRFVRIAGFVFCFKEAANFLHFTDNYSECPVVSSIAAFLKLFSSGDHFQ